MSRKIAREISFKVIFSSDFQNEEEKIEELIGVGTNQEKHTLGLTPRTKRIIENAFREARRLGSEYIGTEHILIGIMREPDSVAVRILSELKLDTQKLYNEIVKVINEYETKDNGNGELEKTSKNTWQPLPIYGIIIKDIFFVLHETM